MSSATTSLEVPCNLCRADDVDVVYPAGRAQAARIVRCRKCGLMYASPRSKPPDCVEIAGWGGDPDWDILERDPRRVEKERLQIRDYTGTRAYLAALYPSKGDLVEVGSSLGFGLEAWRKDGWRVLGVEPDFNCCRHSADRLMLPTTAATLEGANLPSGSADVVVMLHVIEHLPSPVDTLIEIRRVLRPGGMAVIETPRYGGLAHWICGRLERSLGCDGHIYFYTIATLRKTCESVGFKVVRQDLVGRSLTGDRLVYNLGVLTRSKPMQRRLDSASRKMGLQRLRMSLNFRDMQRIIVQKGPE